MAGWLSLGSVVSDPWPDCADSEFWGQLLAPHSELLLNLFIHIGGGAGGQQKTDT